MVVLTFPLNSLYAVVSPSPFYVFSPVQGGIAAAVWGITQLLEALFVCLFSSSVLERRR